MWLDSSVTKTLRQERKSIYTGGSESRQGTSSGLTQTDGRPSFCMSGMAMADDDHGEVVYADMAM